MEPDSVVVRSVQRDKMRVIQIQVDESDRGRIIGKNGKMAKSLRIFCQAMSKVENDEHCIVEILD